ncbi:hypothetical protein AT984_08780 [Paucibacter sp. KCTC 42545]|nr:hypothetical protein AT984_08780 [Paucibacter sp. KCTC 42545]
MVLLIFANTVRDFNSGQYLVQQKTLTEDHIRAVWALQLGLGIGLALLILCAAYPVAWFYQEPRMRDIMLVVSVNYAVNPFGSLTNAWLVREMRFQALAIMRFASVLTGALLSMWLAWRGHGPISLAYGSLCSTIVSAMVAVYFRPQSFPWLPGLQEIRTVLSFGSKLTGSSFISNMANYSPELLLGKLQDAAAVGFYSRANGLVQMFYRLFVDAVLGVCMPWFARRAREDGVVAKPLLKATSYLTVVGWPFCLGLAILADPVISLLYGDQWGESVDPTRILAVATALMVPSTLSRTALLAAGKVDSTVKVIALNSAQTVGFVGLGAYLGLSALAWALLVSASLTAWLWLRETRSHLAVSYGALASVCWQSAKVSVVASLGAVAACLVFGLHPVHSLPSILMAIGWGIPSFVVAVFMFEHPIREELVSLAGRLGFSFKT